MKVVEKLFNNYLNVEEDRYIKKYLAAMSVLELTEPSNSADMKKVKSMRDNLSKEFPISIFKAARFLEAKETRLTYSKGRNKVVELNKMRGHDYKLRDHLGIFIEELNAVVVRSMSKYNTDRGRSNDDEDEDFGFEEINS